MGVSRLRRDLGGRAAGRGVAGDAAGYGSAGGSWHRCWRGVAGAGGVQYGDAAVSGLVSGGEFGDVSAGDDAGSVDGEGREESSRFKVLGSRFKVRKWRMTKSE